MAKQVLEVTDFSAGLNAYSDAKDIKDNQFAQNWNAIVDKAGIIRVSGMAQDHISTDYHDSTNFQKGYGLFQFASDYSFSEISGDFNSGIESGTLTATGSTTIAAVLQAGTPAKATNYYQHKHIFIYAGTGVGESATITGSTDASPPVLSFTTIGVDLDGTSKYIIYNWYHQGWGEAAAEGHDVITDGSHTSMESAIAQIYEGYYAFSKGTADDNQSRYLGQMTYNYDGTDSQLSLKAGVKYNISFRCAGHNKYVNAVADGDDDGTMAISDQDMTTNISDRVPGICLTNASISDSSGAIVDCDDETPPLTNSATDWTNGTYSSIAADSTTSENGSGALFNIVVASGTPTFYFSQNRGHRYVIDDELTFSDPGGGSSSDTGTIVVATVNRTGLALLANGSWINPNVHASILDNSGMTGANHYFCANYINNGDFASTIATDWTEVDSSSSLTLSALNSDGYDGDDGTLKCVADSTFLHTGITPDSYFYQDLTLNSNQLYHLNFLYDSDNGLQFAVEDREDSSFLIPWTPLSKTRNITENPNYRFGGSNYNTLYQNQDIGDVNYFPFMVSDKLAGQNIVTALKTSTNIVRVYFAPIIKESEFRLHGVTVHKGLNDLVTMSYNNYSSSPYSSSFVSWSIYNLSFIIPKQYGDDSNWRLTFNFGSFGFRSGNSLSSENGYDGTGTQKIFIDDINITSDDGDIITLLSDIKSDKSCIHAYSNKNSTWKTNLIQWEDTEAKPVYTYINGMLKICDSNFSTSNKSYMMNFINKEQMRAHNIIGWNITDSPLADPPSVFQLETTETDLSNATFDAIDYLNLYFSNQHFGRLPDSGEALHHDHDIYDTNPSAQAGGTNWNLDEFGHINVWKNTPTYHGIVQRVLQDHDASHASGEGWVSPANDGMIQFLYNIDSDWYQKNLAEGHDQDEEFEGLPINLLQNGEEQLTLTTQGWEDEGNLTYMKHILDAIGASYGPNNPIQMIIKGIDNKPYIPDYYKVGDDFVENTNGVEVTAQGMSQVGDTTSDLVGDVHSVHIDFERISYARSNDSTRPSGDGEVGPRWILEAGRLSEAITEPFRKACVGQYLSFMQLPPFEARLGDENYGSGSGREINSMNENQATYDPEGRMTYVSSQLTGSEGEAHVHGWPWRHDLYGGLTVVLPRGAVKKTDDLLIKFHDVSTTSLEGSTATGYRANFRTGQNGVIFTDLDSTGIYPAFADYPLSTRFKITKVELTFYNVIEDANISNISGASKSAQVDFTFNSPEGATSTGWGDRMFTIATTSVNIYDEESHLSVNSSTIGGNINTGESFIDAGYAPTIKVSLGQAQLTDKKTKRTNFYMKDTTSDIWYLQFYIIHKNLTLHSTTSGFKSTGSFSEGNNIATFHMTRENLKDFNEVNSYEFESGVSQEDGTSKATLTARYKTAVVANNRLYAGNIKQDGNIYGDRMLKSPINKYNLLPASNFIDVAINDGDEITALSYYKDKILQFKKRKVFVINISGDYEFLEDTFNNVGVNQQCQVVTTPHGIVWVNRRGCHLYDGEKLTNLIDNIIPETSDYTTINNNYWFASSSSLDGIPTVGYVDNRDTIVVKWSAATHNATSLPDGASYHFPTKSWALTARSFSGNSSQSVTGAISNMITNTDGDLLYYRFNSAVDTTATNQIKKWNNASYDNGDLKLFYFSTKDFTFGNVSARKKLYKVYITYKADGDSAVAVSGAINSSNDFTEIAFSATTSVFQGTSSVCYGSSTLDDTGGVWKTAEMKFSNQSLVNNIYSFQIQLYSAGIPSDFEINDLSIVYRTKSLK